MFIHQTDAVCVRVCMFCACVCARLRFRIVSRPPGVQTWTPPLSLIQLIALWSVLVIVKASKALPLRLPAVISDPEIQSLPAVGKYLVLICVCRSLIWIIIHHLTFFSLFSFKWVKTKQQYQKKKSKSDLVKNTHAGQDIKINMVLKSNKQKSVMRITNKIYSRKREPVISFEFDSLVMTLDTGVEHLDL